MNELVKAGPNTATYPMHAWALDEILAWEKGVAAASALAATKKRYTEYLNGPYGAWWVSYDAGRAEEPPPFVPEGFDAQLTDNGLGFDLVGSGAPCGPVPIYKKRVLTPSTPGLLPAGSTTGPAFDIGSLLLNAKIYGEPIFFGGAKFLRIG